LRLTLAALLTLIAAPAAGIEGEALLREQATLERGEVLRLSLPDSPPPSGEKRFLAFDARIESKRYRTGSNPCCRVAVNGVLTSIERLRNKRRYYFYNREQRVLWYYSTPAAWTLPYYPWTRKDIAEGQAHTFVMDITNLLKPKGNQVSFTSILTVHAAVVELRNIRLLLYDRFPRATDLGENDPATESKALAKFREKALGYHRGSTVKLNTTIEYQPIVDTVAPRKSFKQDYQVRADANGRIHVAFAGGEYVLYSHFMFPGLGWQSIGDPQASDGWDDFKSEGNCIICTNRKATLLRVAMRQDSHVEIWDTVTNRTDEDLPVAFLNCLDIGDVSDLQEFRIAGVFQDRFWCNTSPITDRQFATTPAVYLRTRTSAVGFVVEDDAYRNHASILAWDNVLAVGDDLFYLEPHACYTFVWKIYPVPDRSYYTLVNAVRHDWNLFQRIPGLFGFVSPHSKERFLPSVRVEKTPERITAFIADTGMDIIGASSMLPDQKGWPRGLYGNETLDLIRAGLGPYNDWRRKAAAGGSKAKFLPYVNPHLCRIVPEKTLADAEQRLPGCLIRDAYGTPIAYRTGWLYCFLPTLGNPCGRHVANVVRMYLDDEKFDGIYFDEWNHSRARLSFNHHDGLSALLDHDGNIVRKIGVVAIMTKTLQVKLVEEVRKRNGTIFVNQFDDTLTAAQLPVVPFAEPGFSYDSRLLAAAQLSRPPHSLHIHKTKGIWNDAKQFLKRGLLMCYYWRYLHGDHFLRRCYPITVKEIRPGIVFGEHKIVTSCSGTFSLGGDRPLTAYTYRGPGGLLVETVEASRPVHGETAIRLSLSGDEIAVIVERHPPG